MLRRLIVLLTVVAIAGVGLVPSQAAVKKKKPDWKGSYSVTLYPDPTEEALGSDGGCKGLSPKGTDKRPFIVPAAGKLTISLVSPDPTNRGVTDWDFYLVAPNGGIEIDGSGTTSNELAFATFKKRGTYELQVCNLIGTTSGTISWVFKYA